MKTLQDITTILKNHKNDFQSKYHVSELAIFGSYSRGDNTEESDLDIMFDYDKQIGWEFLKFASELEMLLNMKVDLVSKKGIKPKYYHYIEKDLIYV